MSLFLDILRVTAGLAIGIDSTVQNVYYLRIDEAGGVADAQILTDMGEYLEDAYTEVVPQLANNCTFEEYKVTNVTTKVDIGISAFPTLTSGTNAGDMLPFGISGLVRARTPTVGREGRKFIGPLVETSQTDGLLSAGLVADLEDFGDEAYGTFVSTSGNTYQPVIYDRDAHVGREMTDIIASNIPAYQRRRKQGVGI